MPDGMCLGHHWILDYRSGLPLLGIVAMCYSGSRNLQELAGRVHPLYGLIFTVALYLTIGPALPFPVQVQ